MVLVTGATGFLGKRVCRKLEASGTEYVKTSLSLGVDLRSLSQTMDLFQEVQPEYVLHCASHVGGIQFGAKHPAEKYYDGLLMQANLLEACSRNHVKRLVNPISNCAYPADARLFREDGFWDGPLHSSVLVYGMVRKMSYVGSVAYRSQHGLDTVNLVLSNMYGPQDHFEEERSHALGALVMKFVHAKENRLPSVCVWGSGKPVREWLHVDDGAEAMVRAMGIAPFPGPINIGVARGISIWGLAVMVKEAVGYGGEIVLDPSKPDGAPYKTVDGSLGEKLFGWKPQTPLRQGVVETVEWYLANHES